MLCLLIFILADEYQIRVASYDYYGDLRFDDVEIPEGWRQLEFIFSINHSKVNKVYAVVLVLTII